jgi:competence CoiA-like predicted nuclease
MTDFHREIQEAFFLFGAELEVKIGSHRADAVYKGYVYEIQCSPITHRAVAARNAEYQKVRWIINGSTLNRTHFPPDKLVFVVVYSLAKRQWEVTAHWQQVRFSFYVSSYQQLVEQVTNHSFLAAAIKQGEAAAAQQERERRHEQMLTARSPLRKEAWKLLKHRPVSPSYPVLPKLYLSTQLLQLLQQYCLLLEEYGPLEYPDQRNVREIVAKIESIFARPSPLRRLVIIKFSAARFGKMSAFDNALFKAYTHLLFSEALDIDEAIAVEQNRTLALERDMTTGTHELLGYRVLTYEAVGYY